MLIEDGIDEIPSAATAATWAEGLDLTYAVLWDGEQDFAATWDPAGTVPETYVLDRDGRVAWNRHRSEFADLRAEIETVVEEELAKPWLPMDR